MPCQTAVLAAVRGWVAWGQSALTLIELPRHRGPAAGHNPIEHPIGRKSMRRPELFTERFCARPSADVDLKHGRVSPTAGWRCYSNGVRLLRANRHRPALLGYGAAKNLLRNGRSRNRLLAIPSAL